MGQSLELSVAGLMTDPGPFSAAPPGALSVAENIAFRRPGVAEPRAKMVYTFDPALADPVVPSCGHVYRHFDGSQNAVYWFGYDGPDSLVRRDAGATVTGAIFPLLHTNCESDGGMLFATASEGVVTLDDNSDTTFRLAGMPRPPAPMIYEYSTPGWLADNTTTAYRVAFARDTPSGRIIISAPSTVAVYRNTTGGSVLPLIFTVLPAEIQEGDILQLYRAYQVTPATSDPADDMRLRYSLPIPSVSIGVGYVPLADPLADDEWNGPALYTNEAQEGILLANAQPGYANDVRSFNGMMFYGGQRTPQELVTTVSRIGYAPGGFVSYKVAAASIDVGNTVTLAAPITAYGATALRVGQIVTLNGMVPGSSGVYFAANVKITAFAGSTITLDTANLSPSGPTDITCWDWLEVDDGSSTYLIAPNAVDDAGVADPMASYLPTAAPLVFGVEDETGGSPDFMGGAPDMERAFTQAHPAAPVSLYAFPSGQGNYLGITIAIRAKNANTDAFTVRSSNPRAFDKDIDATTGVVSTLGGAPGRIAWSKVDVPDAVPIPYYADVGDPSQSILRLMPTQDALFIFKTDGVFRLYGQTPDNLTIDTVDPTARMFDVGQSWVTRYGDTVYALTSRGVCEFGNFGVRVIDQAIHQDIASVTGNGNTGVAYPFAMASSFNKFVLFGAQTMGANPLDVRTNSAFVYWPETGAWSTWTFTKTAQAAGSGFASDGLLGIPNGYATYVDEESEIRGELLAPSYDDPQIELAVLSVSGTTVTYAPNVDYTARVGDAIVYPDDDTVYYVTAIPLEGQVTLDRVPTFTTGSVYPKIGFTARLEWVANAEGNPALQKTWQGFTWMLERLRGGTTLSETFRGYQNTALSTSLVTYDPDLSDAAYGGFKPFVQRDHVPTTHARDWALKVGIGSEQAGAWFSTAGAALEFEPTSTRVGPKVIRNG